MKIQLRKYTVLFSLLLSALQMHAQRVEGLVLGENREPVAFANIVLLTLPDSAYVQGAVSNEQGRFVLSSTPQAKLVRVSAVGYRNLYLPVKSQLGTLQLEPDVLTLNELTVKGDMPHTQIKDDALVTVVQGSILERAGTLGQLLEKIPNVTVNQETVSVFGRGVPEIYINSRKLRDNSELEQISADQVHAIEVITHPGARYGASVPAVIRIRTRKATGDGFSYADRAYVRHNMKKFSVLNQYDFNYRKGGLDLAGMLDLHHLNTREESNDPIYLYVNNTVWKQDQYTMGNFPNEGLNGRASLNYTFNADHAMGIRYDITKRNRQKWLGYMKTIMTQNDVFYDYTYDDNSVVLPESRHSINAYYQGKVGNVTIDWNTDLLLRQRDRDQVIHEDYHDAEGNAESLLIESLNSTTNHLAASKLVATAPWGAGELSAGAEFTYTDQNNDFRNPQQIMESNYSELYEREWALFAEYAIRWGKTRLQTGIRYENINSDHYQNHVRNTDSSRDYKNVFPTFSFTAPLGKAQWSIRYTQGIKRPSYSQMRGSITYICRYAYETGNPMLRPTFTREFSTNLTYKWVQLELGFTHYQDPVFYTSKLLREDDIITYIYDANAPAYNEVTAALNLAPQIGRWSPRWGVAIQKQWIEMDSPYGHVKLNAPYANLTWQNTVDLGKGWLASCDMQFDTRGYIRNAYQYKTNFNMKATLNKSFLKDRWNLQLEGTNILGTYQSDPSRQYCGEHIFLDLGRTKMSSVTLTARYKFNAAASKYRGTGAGQSQRNRM